MYREPSGGVIIIFSLFETSYSWVETLVYKVALVGLPIVVSVVAMTAATSALTTAPTMISTMASACAEEANCTRTLDMSHTAEKSSGDTTGIIMVVHLPMRR